MSDTDPGVGCIMITETHIVPALVVSTISSGDRS